MTESVLLHVGLGLYRYGQAEFLAEHGVGPNLLGTMIGLGTIIVMCPATWEDAVGARIKKKSSILFI